MITFKDMVALLKRTWWKILAISAAVAAICALAGFFLIGKTYTAQAVIFCNVGKQTVGEGGNISVYDPTSRIIGRCQLVMDSGDYRDLLVKAGGDKEVVKKAEITTDGGLGSITVTVSAKKEGQAKSTVELFLKEQILEYMAGKVGDADNVITVDNFEVVSAPTESEGESSVSIIALTVGAFVAAYVVVYLVWLAAVDYRMQSSAEKAEKEEPETPDAEK